MTPEEIVNRLKEITETSSDMDLISAVTYDHMITLDNKGTYSVYVTVNENGFVTSVDSDAFIADVSSGWIKVDEGRGELYKYARTNYCPKGLLVNGIYNYRLVNGVVVYAPEYEAPEDHTIVSPQEQFFVASRNYNTGELITIQNRLFETIQAIPNGGPIIISQNVIETTLEQYIISRTEG